MDMDLDMIDLKLTSEILGLVDRIDEFKGRWRELKHLSPDRLMALKKGATIESVGSSTRIEGAELSDAEVETLISGFSRTSFKSRSEEEVAGYADVMDTIFENYETISVSENHIKQLHQMLLKYSSKDVRHRGEYKKLPNHVETFDSDGKSLGIVFRTATPFDTPEKMRQLIDSFNAELEKREFHSLLLIALFKMDFLTIHPFQGGNGRLSRILTTLFMLKSGYEYIPYSSLERIIEENKDHYYKYLRRGQAKRKARHEWVTFFLRCLEKQTKVLEGKLELERKLDTLPELSQAILKLIRMRRKATVRDIVTVTEANRNTVKAHLKRLVEDGRIEFWSGKRRVVWSDRMIFIVFVKLLSSRNFFVKIYGLCSSFDSS